jgi:protein-L-isoaspartate(D-aspartate) O-methyltransferase
MDYAAARREMVKSQLFDRGIRDPQLLAAFEEVPREVFVPEEWADSAYEDAPLPIAEGQTISQPYIVAVTLEALQLNQSDRVLDVGTGSGYSAAVTSRLCASVWTIERHESLARQAAERLQRLRYTNIFVRHGDGSLGWPEAAPFDAISVAAAGPHPPPALLEQLRIGGRLVIPIGPSIDEQRLVRIIRRGSDEYSEEPLAGVRFVPLIGRQAWPARPTTRERFEPPQR